MAGERHQQNSGSWRAHGQVVADLVAQGEATQEQSPGRLGARRAEAQSQLIVWKTHQTPDPTPALSG